MIFFNLTNNQEENNSVRRLIQAGIPLPPEPCPGIYSGNICNPTIPVCCAPLELRSRWKRVTNITYCIELYCGPKLPPIPSNTPTPCFV